MQKKLYELTEEQVNLQFKIERIGEILATEELTPELEYELKELEAEMAFSQVNANSKIMSIWKVIQNMKQDIDMINGELKPFKDEAARLGSRIKKKKNDIARLERYVDSYYTAIKHDKSKNVDHGLFTIGFTRKQLYEIPQKLVMGLKKLLNFSTSIKRDAFNEFCDENDISDTDKKLLKKLLNDAVDRTFDPSLAKSEYNKIIKPVATTSDLCDYSDTRVLKFK